jgi:hypothetical protein
MKGSRDLKRQQKIIYGDGKVSQEEIAKKSKS